jgi:UDP-4-amino-4,6-dideoxy-N-acetyl-beta-L-altrosamine transaminase
MIPYGKQDINQQDIDAVVAVLQSYYLTQGPQVPAFEKMVADYCGAQYGVAVNSATSALHIACLALGLDEGDWLWTSPNTFVASANCALYCGAQVDFVDIDPRTYNLCADKLEEKLIQAKIKNRLPKIVMPVHFAGQACDMQRIHQLGQQYGFRIIEDASHALGADYLNQKVGMGDYSDITVFSFHPVKIITTAEGGVALTQDKRLAEKLRLIRSHGVTREADQLIDPLEGGWHYQQISLGFNYRMTELQAALGVSQMTRLDLFVTKRRQLAAIFDQQLKDLPLILPAQAAWSKSSYHLYPVQVMHDIHTRKDVYDRLKAKGLGVNVHYIPVHTQPFYRARGFDWGDYPNAESYYRSAVSIPLYPGMSEQDQDYVIQALNEVLA